MFPKSRTVKDLDLRVGLHVRDRKCDMKFISLTKCSLIPVCFIGGRTKTGDAARVPYKPAPARGRVGSGGRERSPGDGVAGPMPVPDGDEADPGGQV